jgi:enoyl-CoA hydratase
MDQTPASPSPVPEDILVSSCGAVLHVTLCRAARRNALAECHWRRLDQVFRDAALNRTRVLVLAGQPGAFSAGADLAELAGLMGDPAAFRVNSTIVQTAQQALADLPAATIAVIDGVCVGGGLGLALACDLRIATPRARFAITPARLGLVYSAADTARLVAAIGPARARDLLLRGRSVDADEALALGLVGEIISPEALDSQVAARAAELLAMSPASIAGIKRVLAHLADPVRISREEADRAFHEAFDGADFAEGARAFLDKRAPRF